MATYYTNFSGDVLDTRPSGWTARYEADDAVSWRIRDTTASTQGGQVMRIEAANRSGISWDVIDSDPNRDNVEVLVHYLTAGIATSIEARALARGGEGVLGSSDVDGYTGGFDENEKFIHKYVPDSARLSPVLYSPSTSEWHWIRYRINGTDHKLKVWSDLITEPTAWDIELTDSSKTTAGVVGLFSFGGDGFVDAVGVGTGGDTAPMSGIVQAAVSTTLVSDASDTALPASTDVVVRVFTTNNDLVGIGTKSVNTDGAISVSDSDLTLESGQSITDGTTYRVDFQESTGSRQRTVELVAAV